MPYEARKNSPTGDVVQAGNCTIEEVNDTFYCRINGCSARMTLVNAGNKEEAYFRRIPTSPYHISADCVRCGISFDPTKYDESKFDKDDAFGWLFTPPKETHKGTTGKKTGKKGGGKSPVRTLGKLYELCISFGKDELYNGYRIGDFFADNENYSYFSENLNGYAIIETSFYKKAFEELALLFNYSTNYKEPHILVKVKFNKENESDFWNYYRKFQKSHHTEPIAIAGDWSKSPAGSESIYECTYYSSRQFYIVK